MHRSGTSLLGRLLTNVGLFLGSWKEENGEAVFFQDINRWLLRQCGARWDNPKPLKYLVESEEALPVVEEHIRCLLDSPRSAAFLGFFRYLRYRSIFELPIAWGWKDPRNTFTLPVWLRLFPGAKIVHISRHGVDVAHSLLLRNRAAFDATVRKRRTHDRFAWLVPKSRSLMESPRCASLDGAFSLWREYQDRAWSATAELPADNVLRLRYEELLAEPQQELQRTAGFCGLSPTTAVVARACQGIKKDRAYAFANDDTLREFAELNQSALCEAGYGSSVSKCSG